VPANPFNTAELHNSNGFQLCADTNQQWFRYNAANFNEFLGLVAWQRSKNVDFEEPGGLAHLNI
jgi:hypothetical protein